MKHNLMLFIKKFAIVFAVGAVITAICYLGLKWPFQKSTHAAAIVFIIATIFVAMPVPSASRRDFILTRRMVNTSDVVDPTRGTAITTTLAFILNAVLFYSVPF